jgi:hypothetical protein
MEILKPAVSVVMLSAITPSAIMLSIVMLCVILSYSILSEILLICCYVIILNVVAPFYEYPTRESLLKGKAQYS